MHEDSWSVLYIQEELYRCCAQTCHPWPPSTNCTLNWGRPLGYVSPFKKNLETPVQRQTSIWQVKQIISSIGVKEVQPVRVNSPVRLPIVNLLAVLPAWLPSHDWGPWGMIMQVRELDRLDDDPCPSGFLCAWSSFMNPCPALTTQHQETGSSCCPDQAFTDSFKLHWSMQVHKATQLGVPQITEWMCFVIQE